VKRVLAVALAALALGGCLPKRGRRVETFDGQSVRALKRLAVPPFQDPRGQGKELSRAVLAGLPALLHETADEAAVARALAAKNKDGEAGLGFETLELLRTVAGVDGLLLARMASDWSSVTLVVHETELGDPALRAILVPRGKKQKAFKDAQEVAAEVLRLLADPR
jgi:hypothetical protein